MARSVGDRRRAHTGRPEGEQPRSQGAVRGETLQRPLDGTGPFTDKRLYWRRELNPLARRREGSWPTPKPFQCSMASPLFTIVRPADGHPNMVAALDASLTNSEATSSPRPTTTRSGTGDGSQKATSREAWATCLLCAHRAADLSRGQDYVNDTEQVILSAAVPLAVV